MDYLRLQAVQYYSVETAQAHSSGITYCTNYQLNIKIALQVWHAWLISSMWNYLSIIMHIIAKVHKSN